MGAGFPALRGGTAGRFGAAERARSSARRREGGTGLTGGGCWGRAGGAPAGRRPGATGNEPVAFLVGSSFGGTFGSSGRTGGGRPLPPTAEAMGSLAAARGALISEGPTGSAGRRLRRRSLFGGRLERGSGRALGRRPRRTRFERLAVDGGSSSRNSPRSRSISARISAGDGPPPLSSATGRPVGGLSSRPNRRLSAALIASTTPTLRSARRT